MATSFIGKNKNRLYTVLLLVSLAGILLVLAGCNEPGGYSTKSLYTEDVSTVYVEMFSNRSFQRGVEYKLTDALAKRIEANTPYKIVSSRNRADSVLSGYIGGARKAVLGIERETGRPLEKELLLNATVNWKNLKTGEMILEEKVVVASSSYSEWQNQGIDYGSALASNKLAKKIVESMEEAW